MRNYKTAAELYYFSMICFLFVTFCSFMEGNIAKGIIWLGFSSSYLCLGALILAKVKKSYEVINNKEVK